MNAQVKFHSFSFTVCTCANKMNKSSELGLPVICRALKVYFGQLMV